MKTNQTSPHKGKTKSSVVHCKPYIQPFERVLAAAEIRGLVGRPDEGLLTDAAPDTVTLKDVDVSLLKKRLAYWQLIEADQEILIPDQIRLELSDESEYGAQLELTGIDLPVLPKRRKLRYGAHDLHEYRGKFFPQLVRALINSLGLPAGSTILDPMCGSGTTILESRVLGMTALGADLNPLSVFLSRVKTSVFDLDVEMLIRLRDDFLPSLERQGEKFSDIETRWNEKDIRYLSNWFDAIALNDLAFLLDKCEAMDEPGIVDFLKVCLSNIVRSVSWQNNDDLRVRKQITPYEPGSAVMLFQEEVTRQVDKLVKYVPLVQQSSPAADSKICEGNARALVELFPDYVGKCDAIITSPPYATALPYIDTDRLSLIVLGLLPRNQHRGREFNMIGNREISERQREALWNTYEERRSELPNSITRLIDNLAKTNHGESVGFRRRNLPSLLSKYFIDMLDVMRQCRLMTTPDGYAFFIVGNNSTRVNGHRVEIPTDVLLWDLGEAAGWNRVSILNMELLPSRDIFRKNRGSSESVLVFRSALERKSIYGELSMTKSESDEWDFSDEDTQEHLHAIHPYPARFIPQIPRKAIHEYSLQGDVVLDPFAGGGTTLLEARLLGRESIGIDNNEVACLVARAKVADYSEADLKLLKSFYQRLPETRISTVRADHTDIPEYKERDRWFDPEALVDLGYIKAEIGNLPEPIHSLALAALSALVVRASYQDSDTRYARVSKVYVPGSALKWYKLKLSQIIEDVQKIVAMGPSASAKVYLSDARSIPFVEDSSVDLIVTSPPYLNAYDYHKYHRHRLHWIGGDVPFARDQEIGKHDKFTRRNAVPEPYFDDMQQCFQEWARVLKPGGHVLIVIGDAIVSGAPVPVGDRFVDIMSGLDFSLVRRWLRTVKATRKSFNGKARIQKEHMLLFKNQ